MVVNSKIRDSDWLTSTLTIVNFNYVFIQPAPDEYEVNILREHAITNAHAV